MDMELGGQLTTGDRSTGHLGTIFLGAQAACRWTQITVLSMKIPSKSDFFVHGLRFAWQRVLNPFPLVITQFQVTELRIVYQLGCQHDTVLLTFISN